MIDEKKLVEEIQGMIVIQKSPDGRNREDELINSYNEAIFDLLKIIEEQPKVNEWIPVEERLPENEKDIGRNYLVTLKYSNLNSIIATCARFEPSGRWLRYCAIGEVDVTDEVIAWMPLPEAYEPQEMI